MRSLVYLDIADTDADIEFLQFMEKELPRRLKLLEADYAGIPWTASFANSDFSDVSMDDFVATVRRNHEDFDAIILLPDTNRIEIKEAVTAGKIAQPYFRRIHNIVEAAGDLPVIAYVDSPGPMVEFNLLSAGVSVVIDQTAEPRLLPMKIARAVNAMTGASASMSIGPLTIDMKTGETEVNGQLVPFTPSERSTLLYLARARGKVRTKEQIHKNMYAMEDDETDIKIVDVFMTKIRGKLNAKAPGLGFDLLRTAWGDGYSMLKDMPANRIHCGLLRLDPKEEGGYVIADTQLSITDTQFEIFEYLRASLGRALPEKDNYLLSNQEALDGLTHVLSSYLVARGPAIEHDPEEGTLRLNSSYFDKDLIDAGNFFSQLRQEIRTVGAYMFTRLNNTQVYNLVGTDQNFSIPELRLFEQLVQVEGQAVRAHSLYRQVRGDTHSTRGEKTPDEDIIDLAKGLYLKLQKSPEFAEDSSRNVYIYHNAYLSFGPAEEEPDPEQIRTERQERRASAQREMLERASGAKVELEKYDCGYFTMLIHPVLGTALIEGRGLQLRAHQAAMLKAVHQARPQGIAHRALFETVYPTRGFNKTKLGLEITHLRNFLNGIDPTWGAAISSIHGYGYACVLSGEQLPAAPKPSEPVFDAVIDWQKTPCGPFTLMVNPQDGSAQIEGKSQRLNAVQVSILNALAKARVEQGDKPTLVSETELYKQVYGNDDFTPGKLTLAVNALRTVLKFHDEKWGTALITRRGRGFALLNEGDVLQEDALTEFSSVNRIPRTPKSSVPALPPQEIELTGGLTLLLDQQTGKAQLQYTDHVLNPTETKFMQILAERYPESIFMNDLQRELQITSVKPFVDNFDNRWATFCPGLMSPIERRHNNRAVAWNLSPAIAHHDVCQESISFSFTAQATGMVRSAALNVDFTLRESELLTLLEKRMGQTMSFDAVINASKMKWTPQMILQTLEAAQSKIAKVNQSLAARISYSKPKSTMALAAPMRRLPVPRAEVA